ncbi:MAG: Arc family DNA-binding protein [Desulfomonile tiedjei]|nr:Arc family DNA-binding protein [Desulfomonile tiedjei]
MPNLSLKNMPQDLYERIRRSAEEHRRSMNSEILVTLETAMGSHRLDPDDFITRVEALQSRIKATPLTDDFLRKAKEDGRR